MTCPDTDLLTALVADALSPADRARVADHGAACAHCHAVIAGLVPSRAVDQPPGADATPAPTAVGSPARGPLAPARSALGPGELIGRYRIGERLGAGGMGVVHAAIDTALQRRVAVKVLRAIDPDPRGEPDPRAAELDQRLVREAQTLARLSHPNVVTVHDVGSHDGHRFVAMELVAGGSLRAWLRQAPRSLDERLDRLLDAARGLAAAHAAGVVHRDVKPDNILVGADGRARVTDFGLAQLGADAPSRSDASGALFPRGQGPDRSGSGSAGSAGSAGSGAAGSGAGLAVSGSGLAGAGSGARLAGAGAGLAGSAVSVSGSAVSGSAVSGSAGSGSAGSGAAGSLTPNGRSGSSDLVLTHLVSQSAQPAVAQLDHPNLTRTGAVVGTPAYLAPEQQARSAVGPATDQWAFCAMVYEVVAGVRPFVTDDPGARAVAIADGRLAVPAAGQAVPDWLRRILARGLLPDPSARWPSMDALIDALVRGRAGPTRRRRALAVAAIVVAVGLALGARGRGHGRVAGPPVARATAESFALPVAPAPAPSGDLWDDPRPGCQCPYSACAGTCLSVCKARSFGAARPVPGVSVPGEQESLLGVSLDGDTILYLSGPRCATDRLMLARRRGDTYHPVDITDQIDRTRVALYEGCCSLTPDGQAILFATPAGHSFVQVGLDGDRLLPPGPDTIDGLIAAPIGVRGVRHPVLSADGLTLYYRLIDPLPTPGDIGPLEGVYASVRPDRDASFPPGQRLLGRVREYDYVSGVSSDGLSLFMADEYQTRVLVRARRDQPFDGPAYTIFPLRIFGWRSIPLGDCNRLLTTVSPGGCAGEDIVWLDAVP